MIKTFILGVILGIAGAAALIYYVPVVDLYREPSVISVTPNGGNTEAFHINLPHDLIFTAARNGNQVSVLPASVEWPQIAELDGSQTEIFKLRNRDDRVVGIAARISSVKDASGSFIQWMMHLPARGTMYAGMELNTAVDGYRNGLLLAGTREFETLNGTIREYFNNDIAVDEREISGRLELVTGLVGPLGDAP